MLEVPIQIGDHELLLHRVHGGETFEMVSQNFNTTTDVIRSLNYSFLQHSLWANTVIVIAPNLKTIDPTLPAFKVYAVTEATTLEDIAGQLNESAPLLEMYNGCMSFCNLHPGDWLLVPVVK